MRAEIDATVRGVRSIVWAVKVAALSLITSYLTVWALAALIADGSQGRFLILGGWLGFLAAVTGWGRKLRRPGRR